MIISASRRTDIPALYSDWFFNRIADGFVVTKNPFNANQLTKLKLSPDVVDAIVFWTKNPAPMITMLDRLDNKGLIYYFQFTLTPYDVDMEPELPPKLDIINTFINLSVKIGRNRVIWRYDPIFLSDKLTLDWHEREFKIYSNLLRDYTDKVVISFLDMDYNNTRKIDQMGIRDATEDEKNRIAGSMSAIAHEVGLSIETCAEGIDLAKYDIKKGKCIDDDLIGRIGGCHLKTQKDKTQRDACGCVSSTDIGIYNTCTHSCVYCYANFTKSTIKNNLMKHNPHSPLLIGDCDIAQLEFKKGQKSLREKQMRLNI
ncbi:MAG: DUF1848 domain-containing protein [Candidatus Adiutrix sp.]|jgi:hypothetical protein|nr:DUF1848 domain-containing protein [Candidatus Adiutrix sp.]